VVASLGAGAPALSPPAPAAARATTMNGKNKKP
jgi:hypothetical protein